MRRNRLIQPTGWSTSQRCRPDKTRQRRIRQPAWALDVGCGVTATGLGVRCRMRRNRLIRPTGWSTSQRCRPDKTRQRRIRQPARALDVGCGVTALSDLRGAALHGSLANYRVVNFLFRLPDAVLHIYIVWRIHHDRQLAVVTQHSSIAQIRGDKFLLFLAIRAGHHR